MTGLLVVPECSSCLFLPDQICSCRVAEQVCPEQGPVLPGPRGLPQAQHRDQVVDLAVCTWSQK